MTMSSAQALRLEQVEFHPASYCDDGGRVFVYEGRLYRALLEPGLETWDALNAAELTQGLIDDGLLVETRPAGLTLEGYGQVLEHRKLPFVSYPAEWCPSMVRDAALMVLELQVRLMRHGLLVLDPSPWNVLFDRGRPVFIDLCSIVPTRPDQQDHFGNCIHYFQNYFINPLVLMSYGEGDCARALSRDYQHHVTDVIRNNFRYGRPVGQRLRQGVLLALRQCRWKPPAELTSSYKALSENDLLAVPRHQKLIAHWLRLVSTLELPEHVAGVAVPRPGDDKGGAADTQIVDALAKLLHEKRPASLIGLGGLEDASYFCPGTPGVVIDRDVANVESLYSDFREQGLDRLPVLMSLRNPTPAHGVGGQEFASAQRRLACDIGFTRGGAFDLFNRHEVTVEQIAQTYAGFCQRGLAIEFTSLKCHEKTELSQSKDWSRYNLDQFIRSLGEHFDTVQPVVETGDGSALLWCERERPDNPADAS